MKVVGENLLRVDAYDKVTGAAKYTDDIVVPNCLVAKVLHSTIANGRVVSIDVSDAKALKGVVAVYTCFDVPDILFPTAGHPWSVEKSHQDAEDRKLLNERVRYYGDDVAVVVAKDEVIAKRALKLIKVEYEEYPFWLEPEDGIKEDVKPLHPEIRKDNVFVNSKFKVGDDEFESLKDGGYEYFDANYETSTVSHCHIEPPISKAYMENGRIIVISSTQIPHIARRVIGQALGMPWGKIRVIKPYIGGGFGNKQDVLYEPLNAWLTLMLGGKPVMLDITREETFESTRCRHAIKARMQAYVTKDGRLIGRKYDALSNKGAYSSHGHAITANCANVIRMMYQDEKVLESTSTSIFTNRATAGAMRAYGIPQGDFFMESQMDDIAYRLGLDPIEVRKKNMMKLGYVDPITGITCHSSGLEECIEVGKKYIGWEEKRKKYGKEPLNERRGVGMAIFCYKTGVYPISLESASARMILNQDGSVQLQMGATEIGQGADTVFSQMAAETIGISLDKVHIVSTQDTDISPFDTGAYASRQSYVSGGAVKKTADLFKQKILDRASLILNIPAGNLDIFDNNIIHKDTKKVLRSMEDFAMETLYSLKSSEHIEAQATNDCKNNTYSFGCTFVDITIDCYLGKIKINDIVNVHDSGKILNPLLAEAQVHGGMSMSLGYGLSEAYIYDGKSGRLLNGNLLDYKIPTAMDHPDFNAKFVETYDESGPYGNKSLGEPPAISVAPAIRNAILHGTGVGINMLPLNPQRLLEEFKKHNLI